MLWAVPNLLADCNGDPADGGNDRSYFCVAEIVYFGAFCAVVYRRGIRSGCVEQFADNNAFAGAFAGDRLVCSIRAGAPQVPVRAEKAIDILGASGACTAAGCLYYPALYYVQQSWDT